MDAREYVEQRIAELVEHKNSVSEDYDLVNCDDEERQARLQEIEERIDAVDTRISELKWLQLEMGWLELEGVERSRQLLEKS